MTPLYIGLGVCGGIFLLVLVFVLVKGLTDPEQVAARRENRKLTANHLKQLNIAIQAYHEVYGQFPPGGIYNGQGQAFHGWQTSILPYLDQAPIFDKVDFHVPWDRPRNAPLFQHVIPQYCRASDEPQKDSQGFALSHWAANDKIMFSNSSVAIRVISDGVSNTILMGEVAGDFKPWGYPANWRDPGLGINQGPHTFGNPLHPEAMFLLGDGTVRHISQNVDPEVLRKLSTPHGGEQIGTF